MFCEKCGAKINDDARFCYNCGSKVLVNENINSQQSETLEARYSDKTEKNLHDDVMLKSGLISKERKGTAVDFSQRKHDDKTMDLDLMIKSSEKQKKDNNKSKNDIRTKDEEYGFFKNYIGIICAAVFLALTIIVLMAFGYASVAFGSVHIANVIKYSLYLIPIALSLLLTIKSKGADFSIPGIHAIVYVFTALFSDSLLGVIISFPVCILLGLLNGITIHYTKIHASIVTVFTASAAGLIIMLSESLIGSYSAQYSFGDYSNTIFWTVALVIFAAVTLLYFLLYKNKNDGLKEVLITYSASAVLIWMTMVVYFTRINAVISSNNYSLMLPFLMTAVLACSILHFKDKVKIYLIMIVSVLLIQYSYLNTYLVTYTLGTSYIMVVVTEICIIVGLFFLMGRRKRYLVDYDLDKSKNYMLLYIFYAVVLLIALLKTTRDIYSDTQFILLMVTAIVFSIIGSVINKKKQKNL